MRLAKALSVGIEFFFRQAHVEKVTPAYRKHAKLGKRLEESVQAAITETAERYIMVEELFPDEFFPKVDLPSVPVVDTSEAEKSAQKLRDVWSLGSDPVNNLCSTLEDCGIRIVAVNGPHGFDGFSCWVNDNVPVIAFNQKKPAMELRSEQHILS